MRRSKGRGLSELAKQDWEARVNKLLDLGVKKMIEHEVKDGKVNGVPTATLIERATSSGVEVFENGGKLYVAKLQHVR
jgi:phosphoribosylformimino-5-aminoimidazole carboxamide ribonucleotide (ProFAR) isomerase